MKLKSYLMSLPEHQQQPEQSQVHNHFKNAAELRKWYTQEHKQEFYRNLRRSK